MVKLSMKAYEKLDLFDLQELKNKRQKFRKAAGVYFLFHKDEILYIGQSSNAWVRIASHHDNNGSGNRPKWDSYVFIDMPEMDKFELDLMEKAYIAKYKPKFNKN